MAYTGKIECVKCKASKGCSKDRWEKLLSKFDNKEEEARASYHCQKCRAKKTVKKAVKKFLTPPIDMPLIPELEGDDGEEMLNKVALQEAYYSGDDVKFNEICDTFLHDFVAHKHGEV